ncbi:hypothetical protein P691DRAFT_590675 [Macrolepiota fuliginosa MF-IS2]|uniref:Uncharacterized protein n=1 Tax=Macrolepiota fuliginosa MF-IS2 TaxID=1400762 RepID=A0A9P5XCR0_9AGAR|nr:hypothetical protein P691DRAFT_590675 [Macrolepiota fuliginosa MF-IS2]
MRRTKPKSAANACLTFPASDPIPNKCCQNRTHLALAVHTIHDASYRAKCSPGRTKATKPLAGVAAPTASTRAKARTQVSAISAEKRPSASASAAAETSSTAAAATADETPRARTVPRQARSGSAAEATTKPKSQPLRTSSLKKEPLKKSAIKDTSKAATSSENATATVAVNSDENPPSPVVTHEEPSQVAGPSESTDSAPSQSAPPVSLPPNVDPLQVAAQTYPWLYMSSTLDACFAEAEKTAGKELDELERTVTEGEAQLADEKLRYDSVRAIEFCDELGSDTFSKEAPAIMQSFISFGEVCERVEAEALQLAMSTPSLDSEEPLHVYGDMMDNLEQLQEQASELESSILRLTGSIPETTESSSYTQPEPTQDDSERNDNGDEDEDAVEAKQKLAQDTNSARAQIVGVFSACLPVLRARIANLSMAQELIDSAQENFSLALRMESMGIE